MAKFNDLAIELQEAIWKLALPTPNTRSVHWLQVEGIPQEHKIVHVTLIMTQLYEFTDMPENWDLWRTMTEECRRYRKIQDSQQRGTSKPFFSKLFSTVPAPVEQSGKSYRILPGLEKLDCSQVSLPMRFHKLDLVVLRLYDSKGRATPLLRYAPAQYRNVSRDARGDYSALGDLCFLRVGIEWHTSWGTSDGKHTARLEHLDKFLCNISSNFEPTMYWMVDGVPRPNWDKDYPAYIPELFSHRMAEGKADLARRLHRNARAWGLEDEAKREALLEDFHLGQEFEANGRRYYIVFALKAYSNWDEREIMLEGTWARGYENLLPGHISLWPEALLAPVQFVGEFHRTHRWSGEVSYILSWEPIC